MVEGFLLEIASVFKSPNNIKKVVELLSTRGTGFTRKEISEKVGISNGSALTEILTSLVVSDIKLSYKLKLVGEFFFFKLQVHRNKHA